MKFGTLSAVTLIACAIAFAAEMKSGLQVGDRVPSYNPMHLTGPEKGKSSTVL